MTAVAELTLVGAHHLHLRRFPDDHRRRFDRPIFERLDETAHAHASNFLVVGKSQVQWGGDFSCQESRRHCQADADEALHVRCPAAIEAVIFFNDVKRIRVPILPIHWNHVRVTGERDTRPVGGTQGGIKIGLGTLVVVNQFRRHAEILQIVADEFHEREIRITAGGIEGDEPLDQVDAVIVGGHWRSFQ
jgi:hypothetical protein